MDYKVGVFGFGISFDLREECVKFIFQFEELKGPDELRAFTSVSELQLVNKCIPQSADLYRDTLVTKLLTTGRSESEPVLFDLLDALARRYQEDFKGEQCQKLKEKVRNELLQAGNQEQAKDYERLAEISASSDRQGAGKLAEKWIEEAADNLDELALRITLAVFNGTTFEVIERAKNDLLESLRQLLPPPKEEDAPPAITHVPLMRRLLKAGAKEMDGEPPDWKRVIKLEKQQAEFAAESIRYVWQQYRETPWRQRLIDWLTKYAVGKSAEVRTRAAVAVGILAIQDYRFVKDNLLDHWVEASLEDNKKGAEYRMAIGMALGVLVREEKWTREVQNLVRTWSRSENRAERWAAVRAYIYVGTYCQPIGEVIERWRSIAASEFMAVYIEVSENVQVRLNNPMHMSLMDAMVRFFVSLAQLPAEEKRPHFTGILEELKKWIADQQGDAGLGVFMFTTLGQLLANPIGSETAPPPVLLQLVDEQPSEHDFRTNLADLFTLLMSNGNTIIEARDLLCTWLDWVNSLSNNSQLYEARMQRVLTDIIAADRSGRMRGKLIACLRDCGRNRSLERILPSL